jgi:hypothetical protein
MNRTPQLKKKKKKKIKKEKIYEKKKKYILKTKKIHFFARLLLWFVCEPREFI